MLSALPGRLQLRPCYAGGQAAGRLQLADATAAPLDVRSPVHAGQQQGCPDGGEEEEDHQEGPRHPAPPGHRIRQACSIKGREAAH